MNTKYEKTEKVHLVANPITTKRVFVGLPPLASNLILIKLSVLFVIFIFSIFFWNYSDKVSVVGVVVPDGGMIRINPKAKGVIREIKVSVGDKVKGGDTLYSIDVGGYQGLDMNAYLEKTKVMNSQKGEVIVQADLKKSRSNELIKQTQSQIVRNRSDYNQNRKLFLIEERKNSVLKKKYDSLLLIHEKKLVSQTLLGEAELDFLKSKTSLIELEKQITAGNFEFDDLKRKLIDLDVQSKLEQSDLQVKANDISNEIRDLSSNYTYDVISPVDGTVLGLQGSVGESVSSDLAIANILPVNSKLVGKIFVSSKHLGFIEAGQSIKISYRAFPKSDYGIFDGVILNQGDSIFSSSEIKSSVELTPGNYLICIADFKSQELMINNRKIPLRVGMEFDANVVLNKKTIFSWLVLPIVEKFKNI